ncbi:MAG: bacteriophage abortive infection AbiH family protein [Paludibacteraceae bacterium]|nr:bacteriophage abortive infection AbiH family protein [Paludibacteraceae bacterium]
MKTKKLYIIGNGFDLAHKLPTSYEDFYEWLNGTSYVQENPTNDDHFLAAMIDIFKFSEINGKSIKLWSDFENALGHLDIESFIHYVANEYTDEENVAELGLLSEQVYAYLNYISKPDALDRIQERFAAWVRDLPQYEDNYPIYNIDKDGLFLTFNYTDTLEKVYRINPNNVLHIHGQASDPNANIVVGHRTKYNTGKYAKTEEKLFGIDADIFPLVVNAMNGLRKPIEEIIADNHQWFDNLVKQNVTEIYLYGLSLGEIDDNYFMEIHRLLPNIRWNFAVYAPGERTQKSNVGKINDFIKRIGIGKEKCFAFNQDPLFNEEIEL